MTSATAPTPIEITETLVRLYVFLAQYLDRCVDEAARTSLPEKELQDHLNTTRSAMMAMVSVNPVVKSKVEKECERVLDIGAACLKGGASKKERLAELEQERAALRHKTLALSDLLAVFRAHAPAP